MTRQHLAHGFALLAAWAISAPAAAGTYVALSVGQSQVKDWNADEQLADGSTISNASSEDTDNGFRIALGFGDNENLSFEVGYVDLGQATAEGDSDGTGFFWLAGPVSAKVGVEGLDIGLVGRIPASETFGFVARAGVFLWDVEVSATDSSGTFGGTDDGNDLFFGVGAEFHASPSISVRGEFTRYAVDESDIDNLALSVISRFGD